MHIYACAKEIKLPHFIFWTKKKGDIKAKLKNCSHKRVNCTKKRKNITIQSNRSTVIETNSDEESEYFKGRCVISKPGLLKGGGQLLVPRWTTTECGRGLDQAWKLTI